MIKKGVVSNISKDYADIIENNEENLIVCQIFVPKRLSLSVGDWVIYAHFNDGTGIVLEKWDG
ncbi:MAG: hypothetical protein ACLU5E_01425 [Anaerovoracaceae bacterium]